MHAAQLFSSMLWAFRGVTRAHWSAVASEEAQVIVAPEGLSPAQMEQWRAQGKRVVEIVMREPDCSRSHAVIVYPFRAEQVRKLLDQLDSALGSTPDSTPFREPCWQFVETLRAMKQRTEKHRWALATDDTAATVHVNGNASSYYAEESTVAAIRSGALKLTHMQVAQGAPPANGAPLRSGHELLWFAAYHASPHPMPSLKESREFRLSRWPNFTALRPLAFQLRITAAVAAGESRVDRIAAQARVGHDEVVRTLNAMAACDLISLEGPATQAANDWRPDVAPRGGLAALIRGVRRHLGLGAPA